MNVRKKLECFFSGRPFQFSIMFVGKARSQPQNEAPEVWWVIKRFIVQVRGPTL
jgi:hypothetical protein